MNISMQLVYQYMAIFFNFSPTLNHLYPLQVENCDSNSRLEVEEDGNGKFRVERFKHIICYSRVYSPGGSPLHIYMAVLTKSELFTRWLSSLIVCYASIQ